MARYVPLFLYTITVRVKNYETKRFFIRKWKQYNQYQKN